MAIQYVFHWADYIVFALLLLSSAVLGLYHGIVVQRRERKILAPAAVIKVPSLEEDINISVHSVSKPITKIRENNVSDESKNDTSTGASATAYNALDVFLGGGSLGIFPVTLSIIATSMSAISLLGTMAEVYLHGIQYLLIVLTYFVVYPVTAEVFMPVFYRLRIVSIHQYLEMRFSRFLRRVVSFVYLFQMILYIAVVLYAPAVAFSQVSGLPVWVTILSTGLVCTIYSAVGGLRAVVWADVLQMTFVIVALLGILIHGTVQAGGLTQLWNLAKENGRLRLANFDPNPFVRHTFWTISVGGIGMVLSVVASNQTSQQRYLACRTLKTAKIAVWLNLPLTMLFMFMLIAGGVVCYVLHVTCDPKKAGLMGRYDQILPFTVMQMWHTFPGLPGVFLSCIFAAALSTVSSGVNSLSTVVVEDLMSKQWRPFHAKWVDLSTKVVGILMGLLTISLAFLGELLTPTVLQLSLSIFGLLGGPILAIFCQGLFMPFVNSKGAFSGLLVSLAISIVIFVISATTRNAIPDPPLPLLTSGCPLTNVSNVAAWQNVTNVTSTGGPVAYHLSYLYYTAVSVLASSASAVVVSAVTGWNPRALFMQQLYYPPALKLLRHLPTCCLLRIHLAPDSCPITESQHILDGSPQQELQLDLEDKMASIYASDTVELTSYQARRQPEDTTISANNHNHS